MSSEFKDGFFEILWLIRKYLPVIVISGGWAPLLYYNYLLGDKTKDPIRTRDIDIAVKKNLPQKGSILLDQLLCNAGLKPIFKSTDIPPIVGYKGVIKGYEVEIEFLTDQTGALEAASIEVQKGLTAQALRFISILVENSIELNIDDYRRKGKLVSLKVHVPTPAAFVFHKGLIYVRRSDPMKKEKDLYYIFDILATCEEIRNEIIQEFAFLKRKYPDWFKTFIKNLEIHFSNPNSEGVKWVNNQRPSNAFPGMSDNQFINFIFGTFQNLLSVI